jgi:hypothetical protein
VGNNITNKRVKGSGESKVHRECEISAASHCRLIFALPELIKSMALRSPLAYTEYQHETPTRPLSLLQHSLSLARSLTRLCAIELCKSPDRNGTDCSCAARRAHTQRVPQRESEAKSFSRKLKNITYLGPLGRTVE